VKRKTRKFESKLLGHLSETEIQFMTDYNKFIEYHPLVTGQVRCIKCKEVFVGDKVTVSEFCSHECFVLDVKRKILLAILMQLDNFKIHFDRFHLWLTKKATGRRSGDGCEPEYERTVNE